MTKTISLVALLSITLWTSVANAHFLWLVPTDQSGSKVNLYFSEGPEPDNPELLKRLSTVKVVPYRTKKPSDAIGFQFENEQSTLAAEHSGATAWTLTHTLGTHGRDEKNLIIYNAASIACRRPGMEENDLVHLPKEGITAEPYVDGTNLRVQIWSDENAASNMKVELQSPNDHQSLTTDGMGKIEIKDINPGVYAVRCLEVDDRPGEHDGVAYKAVKKYTTVSFIVPSFRKLESSQPEEIAVLPQAITSFGAASVGETIYAIGGHTGGAHSYSNEEQFNKLIRLDLKTNKTWENIAEGPRVQGNALVSFNDNVILIGGFSAENATGEKGRLVSQSLVQMFDLAQQKWIAMPSLPEARSSMDATVLGDHIYVVGGWSMNGNSAETQWLKTAWKLSLRKPEEGWTAIAEPPFERRAIAVVSHAGRVFVIGGMDRKEGPTTETFAYLPENNTWEKMGAITGVPMNGFGAAAVELQGKLFVSAVDGSIQQFDDDKKNWSVIGQVSTGRFFHRMLPVSSTTVGIFGGSNMNVGKFQESEFLELIR
jgi:uncharacterized GH25 family protein